MPPRHVLWLLVPPVVFEIPASFGLLVLPGAALAVRAVDLARVLGPVFSACAVFVLCRFGRVPFFTAGSSMPDEKYHVKFLLGSICV